MRWPLLLVPFCLALLPGQDAGSSGAPQEPAAEDSRPYPNRVTESTRQDPAALARLQRPGQIVFVDRFESDESFAAYFEINGRRDGRATIDREAERAHGGEGCLRLVATANDGNARGASPVRWLGDSGYDCLHLRYWIRYAADYDQGNLNHTGGSLSGVAGTFKWTGMGSAGKRPAGDDHFSTRVEGWRDWGRTEPPGWLFCYTYWMDMKRDRDGNYWGNMLGPIEAERFVPPRDRWLCVEERVQCNTPGKADGELAVWLDGELYLHYTGFRWRSTDAVRLKRMALMVYIHHATRDNTVWYDDVVLSTGYIGPGKVEGPDEKKAEGKARAPQRREEPR